MNLAFLQLPPAERAVYFEQAALQRDLSPVILEKDFWVCWLLGVLFESEFAAVLTFKGGTSLSKVFGAIDRFSEDIDLSLAPTFIGVTDIEPQSRNQADKWMKQAEAKCAAVVRDKMQPALERRLTELLGPRAGGWLEYHLDAATNSPTLLFHYPTTQPTGFAYLRRAVKLELGSLTDQQPTGRHPVRPWILDDWPGQFTDWRCAAVVLEIERTFWEKATILHAEYHRPAHKPMPLRFSRHYADTAALGRSPIAARALADAPLRDRVVAWKSRFFGSGWANYDRAKPGSFQLVPPAPRLSPLRDDYDKMREMYLAEPVSFDQVLADLAGLEQRINS